MAILDSTIVKGDLTVTGTIRGLGSNSSGSGGSSIEQVTIGANTLFTDSSVCKVEFSLNSTTSALYDSCALIIFTMNNSFVTCPRAPSNLMLCCGSFRYDGSGNSMLVRLKIEKNNSNVVITFDNDFRDAILRHSSGGWGAMLLGIKF